MNIVASISIDRPADVVWQAITAIEHSQEMISSILNITVLHQPEAGVVGLKWEETREMFGKEAMETMWITDAVTNEFYTTRAESHGSIYTTALNLRAQAGGTELTLSFGAVTQSYLTRILAFLTWPFIKSSLKKSLLKDLQDIKVYIEKK